MKIIKIKHSYPFFKYLLLFSVITILSNCKKFVDVPPPSTSVTGPLVFKSDASAIASITGIYITMSEGGFGGLNSSLLPSLSSDELTLISGANPQFLLYYTNNLTNLNGDFWNAIYPIVYRINSSLDGLNSSTTLTPAVKNQLIGEAKFLRAFCYFYLVNYYGDVPLVLTTDYKLNSKLSRSPSGIVVNQVIADLIDAQNLLSAKYVAADVLTATTERVRPNKWVATALLSRAYLYDRQWSMAEKQSTQLIENTNLFHLSVLDSAFLNASLGNNEAIWQLQPVVIAGQNTQEAQFFILQTEPTQNNPAYISQSLIKAFELGDQRKSNWIDSVTTTTAGTLTTYYYPYKYKVSLAPSPITEYEMVMRLGEQYLIRAESRAEQNNISGTKGALADLNVIRNRAGLQDYDGLTDQSSVLTAVFHERQVELFTEWGHRWLDIKRTGKINEIMLPVCIQKGGTWNSNKQLYPLPQYDLQSNSNLVQNPGY